MLISGLPGFVVASACAPSDKVTIKTKVKHKIIKAVIFLRIIIFCPSFVITPTGSFFHSLSYLIIDISISIHNTGNTESKFSDSEIKTEIAVGNSNDSKYLQEEESEAVRVNEKSGDNETTMLDTVSSDDTDIEVTSNSNAISVVTAAEPESGSNKQKSNIKIPLINKKIKFSDIPEYSGLPIAEIHNDRPFFRKKDKKRFKAGTEYYSPLDELGRCGIAYACVGVDTIPDENEERGAIGQIRPSGWHTVKYADIIPDLYLYNRCHLIGWQLGAENANECNLITGTRYMNVSGMLPYENMIADYVRRSGNHVMYRVTPFFLDDELVARGVLLEAQSIETIDISFCVWCYNVQPGIIIDYETGDSRVDEHYTVQIADGNEGYAKSGDTAGSSGASGTYNNPSSGTSPGMGEDKDIAAETTYVLNTNTHKFHYVDCPSVKQMATHNMEQTTMSREEIIAAGYSPCGNCKP